MKTAPNDLLSSVLVPWWGHSSWQQHHKRCRNTRRQRKELNTMAVSFEAMLSETRRPTWFPGYWSHHLATGQPGDKSFHILNCRGHKYNHNNICYIFVWKLQWSSDVQYYYYFLLWSETEITLPLFYLLFCFFFRKGFFQLSETFGELRQKLSKCNQEGFSLFFPPPLAHGFSFSNTLRALKLILIIRRMTPLQPQRKKEKPSFFPRSSQGGLPWVRRTWDCHGSCHPVAESLSLRYL